ncbi:unnamed protein product [Mytilus coruscus]|uniref:DZIP3-like HEPN domain-containing protein n=1 Tax=Mytilus coruscus TaxID=42192 RepID=A0A6J8CLI8_MYTCO|nr:unnamed protein product [Mytilus coruscus]
MAGAYTSETGIVVMVGACTEAGVLWSWLVLTLAKLEHCSHVKCPYWNWSIVVIVCACTGAGAFWEDCLATTIEFKTEVFYKIDEIRAMIELEVEGSLLPNLNGIKVLSIKLKYEHLVPSSQNFSMRLMICLLRNLADYRKVDKSSAIDLERITKCRNEIAHIPVSHISEGKYGEMLDILTEALQRLGGSKYFTLVNKLDLIMKKSTSQEVFLRKLKTNLDSTLESVPENDQLDYDEDLNSGSESERKQLNLKLAFLLNRLVERVTRELFNKEFPPKQLAETIKKKQGKLLDLKKKKKLTQTQCMSLFPSTGGSPSSEKFEFALMVRLVWEFHEKEEYITKEMYCDLQELERLTDSLKKLNYSQIEMAKIVKASTKCI